MANKKHLALLKQGVEVWNNWRKTNREIKPDLIRADLSQVNLIGADLSGGDLSRANFSGVNLRWADLRWANLSGANLSGKDLRETNLSGVNLSMTNLSGRNLSRANFSGVNLSGTNLSGTNLSGANFSGVDFSGVDLSGVNLSGVNLSGVNLSGVNLSGVNLSRANLSRANLSRTQALQTDFEGATFTGACIEDWNINSETNLKDVICDYVYLKEGEQERRPHDPNKNFAPGEFTKIFQEVKNTAELIFSYSINWRAFAYAFNEENIQVYNTDGGQLFLREYKALEDGLIVLKVTVPPGVNKDKVRENLILRYERKIASLEGELKAKNEMLAPLYERLLLPRTQVNLALVKESGMFEQEKILILQKIVEKRPIKDSQIANDLNLDIHKVRVILNQLKESKFIESIEHKQSQDPSLPKIDLILVTEITSKGYLALKGEISLNTNTNPSSVVHINSGNVGIAQMNGGEIKGNAKVAAVINEAQQQNLTEAATEIQQLLEQLSNTYPTSTPKEKMAVVTEAVEQIEKNPTLKAKVINALKAGGIETFKEAVNHPLVNILVAFVEGWQEAE